MSGVESYENGTQLQTHKEYIDVLRILAIIGVLVQHTVDYYFETGNQAFGPLHAIRNLSCYHVCIFVMISGALFLQKEITVIIMWKKYIKRIFMVFVVWSGLYSLYNFAQSAMEGATL